MKFFQFHSRLPKSSLLIAAAVIFAFSFLTAWFFQSKPSITHQQKLLQDYLEKQETDAYPLLNDTALLRRFVLHKESPQEFEAISDKKYGLFIFAETISESGDLVFWNSHNIIPPSTNFAEPDGISLQLYKSGYFVVHKKQLRLPEMSSNLVAYVLIPVMDKYYTESPGVQTRFVHDKDAIKKITLTTDQTEFPVRSINGKTLFHVTPVVYTNPNFTDAVTLILRLLALTLILVYLQSVVEKVRRQYGAVAAVAMLVVVLTICRLFLLWFPYLFSLRQLPLFDPTVYASSSFNRSLGDLLINSLFLCWMVYYAWTILGPIKKLPSFLKGYGSIIAGVAGVFLLIWTTFELSSLIYDLVANSKVSFSVTDFFSLHVYTIFGFLVLALLCLTYYYFSRFLFRFVLLAMPGLLYLYFTVAVAGLVFLSLHRGGAIVLFYLPVLAWLVIYTLLLNQGQQLINRLRISVAGILFWIVVFSISLAVLVMKGSRDKEWRERRAIAEKFDELSEPLKEKTLSVALAYLTPDYLRNNFPRFYNETENAILRDSFVNSNFLGYASAYNTKMYVFDSTKQPIGNSDKTSYDELNDIITRQSKPIGDSSLSYYETSFDQFVYITKRAARDSNGLIGTMFIVATPKYFQSENKLYPIILRQSDPKDIRNSPVYSFAIYDSGQLKLHSGRYSFPTEINVAAMPGNEVTKRETSNTDELWYKSSKHSLVIIARTKNSFIESITLFSYLFCSFLLMGALLRVSSYYSQQNRAIIRHGIFSSLNIRSQIHGTIILIAGLSFLVIGIATISFFIQRYKRSNVEQLSRAAFGAVNAMEQEVEKKGLLTNNVINFSDTASVAALQGVLGDIANAHGLIVNIYDLNGNLKATSDNEVYQRGLLSWKMNPQAYYDLRSKHLVQRAEEETANQLAYQSIYIAMRSKEGKTYAYLNMPSFYSEISLQQEISNFMVTIINLNAFIFLVAGVIALFITNRITRSFSIIADKMKAVTLGRTNEEIVWTRDDEIGELVKQYNKMVRQLEQSANALAKSEREGAWREMARQVAHEIKNPLTPMKLSIQYLQRAIQTGQPNVQQLTSSVATTLIEQIDHLSKIAADFSQFANIGNKKLERVDLHTVIRSLVDLYAANPKIKLTWNQLEQPVWLHADKTQLNRLFTNLLTNAVDACAEARSCEVAINEKEREGWVIVSVTDNGEGIPVEMQSKIFTPNFTTKTSGTGLGLAMCKSIVEQSGGAIWFETKVGEGTTFFVQLPLLTEHQL
ncbi:MAG TPA: ATP-binding protein [Flavisolibacter sp.]|nr:ATP-binding protein [Flavisolibacter sp.]